MGRRRIPVCGKQVKGTSISLFSRQLPLHNLHSKPPLSCPRALALTPDAQISRFFRIQPQQLYGIKIPFPYFRCLSSLFYLAFTFQYMVTIVVNVLSSICPSLLIPSRYRQKASSSAPVRSFWSFARSTHHFFMLSRKHSLLEARPGRR